MKLSMKEAQNICTDMLFHIDKICEENGIHYFAFYGSLLGAVRHKGPIPWDYDVDLFIPEPETELFVSKMQECLPEKYWINYRSMKGHPRCFARIGLAGHRTEILHIDAFRLCGMPSNQKKYKAMIKKGRMLFVAWKAKMVDPDFYYADRPWMKFKAKVLRFLLTPIGVNRFINAFDKLCNQYAYDTAEYVGFPYEDFRFEKADVEETIRTEYDGIMIRIPRQYDKILKYLYGDYMTFPPKEECEKGMNMQLLVREM